MTGTIFSKLSIKEQAIIACPTPYKRWYPFNFKLWFPTTESPHFFHGSVCVSSTWLTPYHVHMGMCTCRFMKAHAKTCSEQLEELWSNFKVELRWLPMTELTQFFPRLITCDSLGLIVTFFFSSSSSLLLLTLTSNNF